ncbi:hypothetical protein K9M74_03555 [Candidatus Woesearchaeota archaeon]|nr:hypothetical protein [Candidatus Woesearchaeota archaeon]
MTDDFDIVPPPPPTPSETEQKKKRTWRLFGKKDSEQDILASSNTSSASANHLVDDVAGIREKLGLTKPRVSINHVHDQLDAEKDTTADADAAQYDKEQAEQVMVGDGQVEMLSGDKEQAEQVLDFDASLSEAPSPDTSDTKSFLNDMPSDINSDSDSGSVSISSDSEPNVVVDDDMSAVFDTKTSFSSDSLTQEKIADANTDKATSKSDTFHTIPDSQIHSTSEDSNSEENEFLREPDDAVASDNPISDFTHDDFNDEANTELNTDDSVTDSALDWGEDTKESSASPLDDAPSKDAVLSSEASLSEDIMLSEDTIKTNDNNNNNNNNADTTAPIHTSNAVDEPKTVDSVNELTSDTNISDDAFDIPTQEESDKLFDEGAIKDSSTDEFGIAQEREVASVTTQEDALAKVGLDEKSISKQLAKQIKTAERKMEQVEKKQSKVQEAKERIKKKEEELKQLENELAKKKKELAKQEKEIQKKELKFAGLTQEGKLLVTKKAEVEKKIAANKKLAEKLKDDSEKLIKQEKEITSQSQSVNAKKTELKKKENDLHQQFSFVEEQQKTYAQKLEKVNTEMTQVSDMKELVIGETKAFENYKKSQEQLIQEAKEELAKIQGSAYDNISIYHDILHEEEEELNLRAESFAEWAPRMEKETKAEKELRLKQNDVLKKLAENEALFKHLSAPPTLLDAPKTTTITKSPKKDFAGAIQQVRELVKERSLTQAKEVYNAIREEFLTADVSDFIKKNYANQLKQLYNEIHVNLLEQEARNVLG